MLQPKFVVPNFFTSLNFLIGVWAAIIATGITGIANPVIVASNMVIYCVLLDKLDGFAARLMKASSEFGAQFDSLADLVAFGIAPVFLIIFGYKTYAPEWYSAHQFLLFAAGSLFVLCSAMRLAKYNAMDADGHPDYFVGMPTTFAGAANAILMILAVKYGFLGNTSEYGDNSFLIKLPILVFTATAILMVAPLYLSKLKSRKNKALNIIQIICIVVSYTFGFAMIFPEFLIALVAIYFVIGFGFGLVHREEIHSEEDQIKIENKH
jgi:CDP-diacylglycerol--serine O-phosphatidyltransferase